MIPSNDFHRSRAVHVVVRCLLILALCAATNSVLADEPPNAVLRLIDGDFVSGELLDCELDNRVRWRSAAFESPFEFFRSGVGAIDFPKPDVRPAPAGDFRAELLDGEILYGALVAWSDDSIQLKTKFLGHVRVDRSRLQRLRRWNNADDLVYFGPNGLEGWRDDSSPSDWKDEGGNLSTTVDGATLFGDLGVPTMSKIEIDVSWPDAPNFVIELGVDDSKTTNESPFRIEVWDDELVVIRETTVEADVGLLCRLTKGPGGTRITAYLDQENGRFYVFAEAGQDVASLQFNAALSKSYSGMRLINRRGAVRLERIQVSKWDGDPPRKSGQSSPQVRRTDGALVSGQVVAYDPKEDAITTRGESAATRIPLRDVQLIVAPPTSIAAPDKAIKHDVQAVMLDGARLSGEWLKVENGQIEIKSRSLLEPIRIPIAQLRTLVVLSHSEPSSASGDRRIGRLELDGVRLTGSLLDADADAGATCFNWKPRRSDVASRLRDGESGRIVYQEWHTQPVEPPAPQNPRVVRAQRPAGVLGVFFPSNQQTEVAVDATPNNSRLSLHLRTGDTAECTVDRIDERGVWFTSSESDAKFVPHDRVKAVEIAPLSFQVRVNEDRFERLLTLPRMQRDNPPTHLIRSKNGDCLRCRLLSMDDEFLNVEVRLDRKKIRRDYVSRIIWLHEDELAGDGSSPATLGLSAKHVQTLRSGGTRVTFVPESVKNSVLAGVSELLGECKVDIAKVDQILIGQAIEEAASGNPYQQWRLRNAIDPKFVDSESGDGSRASGMASTLVGEPAPEVDLRLLNGERFRLRDHRGSIVVLDFWATWCGPCIQAMPEVDRVVNSFPNDDVILVAVNLQESPEQIQATLERLDLKTTVALDVDGVAAQRYQATAIPQTVVIDRDGAVARLYVGGGPQTIDALQAAIEELMQPGASAAKADDAR